MSEVPVPVERFDVDDLLDDARRSAGLDDFGQGDFREGLAVLLETYRANGYDDDGMRQVRNRIVSLLAERLRIEDGFARHPEIRDVPIAAPMYLTGLPRTGTSALLSLLATDPAMRPMALWEGMNPAPLPGAPRKEDDPRYVRLEKYLDRVYSRSPGFGAIHHTTPDTPEECIHLLNHTFEDVQFGVEVLMEPYASWFRNRDHHAAYRYYADLLRMLQWQRPGERFLLKSPAHLWALDVLVEMFGDCSIVVTHRDPVESVASYCSMMETLMAGREVGGPELGPAVLEYLAASMDHAMSCRRHIDPARIIDVSYRDLIADPLGAVRSIYGHFGMTVTDDLDRALSAHAAAHPRGAHGQHEYALDRYGLSAAAVRERFSEYLAGQDL